MSYTVENLEKSMAKITITVDADAFEEAMVKSYNKNKKNISIQGFRKGKAPRKMVEKLYGPEVFYEDAANFAIPDAYEEAAKESGLEIVSRPEIDVVEIEKGKDFVFTATVAVKPEVTLGEYKGVEVPKSETEVTDEDVAREVWDNEKQYLELKDVDRPAEEGDVLTIDFTGYVDGESSDNLKGTDTQLELGSGTFIPGFEDQLIGVNAEDDVEVNVVFPDEYYEEVAGKEARFEVHVSKVQAYDTSVWNDEYVKQNTDYESQEDMENSIRSDLESTAQSDATSNWEYDLIQEVLNGSEFQIEESDKDLYVDQMMSEYESYAAAANMELDDYLSTYLGTTEAQLREFFRTTAEFRVKMTLVFHEIAQQEGITVSDQEYEDRLNELAKQYNYENTDDIVSLYSEEMIREEIVQEKVISLIEENAVQPE